MSRIKRAFHFQLIGLVLAAAFVVWLVRTFPVAEYITRAQTTVGRMEMWGGVLYPLLFAACNVLLLPGGPFWSDNFCHPDGFKQQIVEWI